MVRRSTCSALVVLALSLGARAASAEEPRPAEDDVRAAVEPTAIQPAVHHAPVSMAEAHEPLFVTASIDNPHLVKRAVVMYRTKDAPQYREVELLRGSPGPYVAEIPAEHVAWPSVEYTIELETTAGERWALFATRDRPHRVQVSEDLTDMRERALHERVRGRRSVVSTRAEYVSFGSSPADVSDPATGTVQRKKISDRYWRVEGAYSYRPLRTITEFSIRLGVVRGRSPVPGVTDEEEFDVGLNYGSPSLTVRATDWLHFRGDFLTSVTEVGFSLGAGGSVIVGDPYGGKLTVGFETIDVFGTRFFSKMDVLALEGVTLAPMVEVTDMPHADEFGVRLLTELSIDAGNGFGFGVQGGYQARDSASGGVSGGARVEYGF